MRLLRAFFEGLDFCGDDEFMGFERKGRWWLRRFLRIGVEKLKRLGGIGEGVSSRGGRGGVKGAGCGFG